MADPFNPNRGLNLNLSREDEDVLNSLFKEEEQPAQVVAPQQDELSGLMAGPSPQLAQAQNFIALRDDPQAIDLFLGTAERLKNKQLPFNKQAWEDAQANVLKYQSEIRPQILKAEQEGNWGEMTKLAALGVGKVIGAYIQSGFGATNEQLEKAQQSLAARNYVGTIKDPEIAAKAIELNQVYTDDLLAGKAISPAEQKPGMAFGTGPFTAKLGMNLAMAESYLKDLQSDRNKKLGTAGLRNFAIQSGDAFLPFVSIGDIVVDDESNPDQVARRAALTNAINETIQKDYGISTLAGAALGSVGSFITVGSGATKLLGRAGELANATVKTPSVLSRGATYATIGASQSFEGDPRNLSPTQRMASIFSEAAVLGLAEGVGNKLENSIDNSISNYLATKALAAEVPAFVPLVGSMGRVVATTLGETTSEELEAILRGQDPVEPLLQNLGVSFGIGLGMAGVSGVPLAARAAKIRQQANQRIGTAIEDSINAIRKDPDVPEEQKQVKLEQLRTDLRNPKYQQIFDAAMVSSAVDPTLAPETAKVAKENLDLATQDAADEVLSKAITRAERAEAAPETLAQPIAVGVQPQEITRPPESPEEIEAAFGELASAFERGAESIELAVTPQNQAKIQWLESQGKVFGERVGDNYVVRGVKVAGPEGTEQWIGETDPDEVEADLTDSILERAENLSQEDYDDLETELRNAKRQLTGDEFLLEKLESIAVKYLGPDEGVAAVEKQLATEQERVEEEKPAQFNIDRINAAINSLQTRIRQVPPEEIPALEEQLSTLRSQLAEQETARQTRGEESVSSLVQKFEREVDTGVVSPEVAERGDVILAINNPETASFQELQRLDPDPRENNRDALGQVFNLQNPATVELLQSIGAIDENNRPILTPAETVVRYLDRKNSYLRSRSLAGYQGMNISDEVSSAVLNTFLLEMRRGKNNISLSTLFNSKLRDFIRAARPRMRAGVGIGGARRLETQIPGRVDFEALAEAQGLNPTFSSTVNEVLSEVDATEVDFQGEQTAPVEIPSISQRYEALSVIAEKEAPTFRNGLKSDLEKLAFDSIVSDVNVAVEAKRIGKTETDVSGIRESIKERFKNQVTEAYRTAQAANTLPIKEVVDTEAVKEGALTSQNLQPVMAKMEKFIEDFVFDPAELEEVRGLRERVQNTRRAQDLKKFDDRMTEILVTKLDEESLDALSATVFSNLQGALDSDRISQELADDYLGKFNKLEESYNNALEIENEADPARLKGLAAFRSALLKLNKQLLVDSNLIETEEGISEKTPEATATQKPAEKLGTDQRRKTNREKFQEILSGKPVAAKRVGEKPVQEKPKRVEERAPERPAIAGRGPRAARAKSQPVPANFAIPRQQQTLRYDEKSLSVLGEKVLKELSAEQKQDVAAAVASIEGSKNKSFYLANGPGTGKTRVLLSTAKYYLDKGFSVIYLTESEAVAPDWDAGTIGGSIEKDAAILGVPLAVRGGKGDNGRGLPIEKVPNRVLVSTYDSSYLPQISPLVDEKTVVIFDEHHAGRNLFKYTVAGESTAEAVLMDEIGQKAGRVMMASGTPFDRFDQLYSLRRLGIFDSETPEQLGKRLGFETVYTTLSGKKTKKGRWVASIDENKANANLSAFLETLTGDGKMRSRSLKLDNVDVRFKDVPLDEAIIKRLTDIKDSYGGDQNVNLSSRRSLRDAQKRALEEYKVKAAAAQALDAIRRGKKPVIYVGFVSKEDARGNTLNPSAIAVEKELLAANKDLKIARMYGDSGQAKGLAMAQFNDEDADVLIATKEMGGTGIELDDKYGDSPREMIILSLPVSGVQAAQLVYRVRRVDSASYPTIVFLTSEAEVDRLGLGILAERLNLLDATLGVGLDRLQQTAQKVNEDTKIFETVAPAEADIAAVEKDLSGLFGKAYAGRTITLKDAKGVSKQYAVEFSDTIDSAATANAGDTNESDFIRFNPKLLQQFREGSSPKDFNSYLSKIVVEETIHIETFRYYRDLGLDPTEELIALGEAMGFERRLAHARLYYSTVYRSDVTTPEAQDKIMAMANNPYLAAAEAIRQITNLNLTGSVTEQAVLNLSSEDKKRIATLAKEIDLSGSSNLLSRMGVWFDSMATTVKKGLGLAPTAIDRLALKPAIEDAIVRLRGLSSEFVKASEPVAPAAPTPGTSPTRPRTATVMDSFDLRLYRQIENHLEGRTEGVLGVSAAADELRTVSVDEWVAALDTASRRGLITRYERNLFRAAAKPYISNGRVSLALIANDALRISEEQAIAGTPAPTAALISIASPESFEITDAELGAPTPTPAPYRVRVGDAPIVPTTATTAAKAFANAAYRSFQNQEVITFNGRRYTRSGLGALINAAREYGFEKLATRLDVSAPPAPEVLPTPIVTSVSLGAGLVNIPVVIQPAAVAAPVSRLSPSKAIANITAKYKDAVREDVHKESLFEAWQRQSVPREEQFAAARDYIASHPNGFSGALTDFLSGNVKTTLPVQGALGFELARVLGPRAKADKYYESKLVEVMLVLSKKYGTEPGQAVDLWNALGEMSDNPEAMKIFINRQIDSAVKNRLVGYKEEEEEVASGLKDASRRAADSMATDSKTQSTLDKIAKLVELKKKKATFAEVEAAVRGYLASQEAIDAASQFLGEDLGAGAPDSASSDADGIRLDPAQTKALSTLILQIIQRSENPAVTAASPEDIKRLVLLVPALRDAKNQANVQRKLDLYFEGALAVALETIAAEALGEAQAREKTAIPASFGEGRRRAQKAVQEATSRAPAIIPEGQPSKLATYSEAFAESLQRRAARLQEEPEKKKAIEIFVDKLRRDVAARIREEGGLQPAFEPEPPPTEAEVLRDRIARFPDVLEFINNTRDALLNNYTDEERVGLEPIFEEVLDLPITVSSLKRAISSLESIGGPRTNVRSLIRSSKGDIEAFENKMLALLTENTDLDAAERQTVMGYLRETMTNLIAQERKKALQIIKDRFERRKERKTRKIRTALDKLVEATNLGVLNDSDLFAQMHSQLGLPELKDSERARLNQLIEDLPKYPVGRIRNKKISEMYQYVKLVSPQLWGELIVNYQTANVLAGLGTIGINAWSALISNVLNSAILGSVAGVKKVFGSKSAKASFEGTAAYYEAILGKEKPAVKAALDTLLRGNYGNSVDSLTQELGGVNIWEAILDQGEAFRYGKPGAVKPELPVRAFGQEFRIPLDSKFISSKYGILAPFIWFGRAMSAGDAFNRLSARKMYEVAEATNLAIAKGLKTEEEIDAEVTKLLNLSPEARRRAEARAKADAKEFGFENDPIQIQLRVEEILEQSRPDTEEVRNMVENAQKFAGRAAFTGDFEGLFGLIAESLTTLSAKFWPARLVIKFLRTGSNLANEVLNFMPVISTLRLYRGTGNFFGALKGTKYYKAPPVPGSIEHDLLVGKMTLGLVITAGLLAALKEAMDGEDDPKFMLHFKGPLDPAQREAFFAAGGSLRSIQYGRFKDGRPKFLSMESLPVGLAGPLLLAASIVETIRYEKRSKAETFVTGALMGGLLATYGVLDMAALSGIRQIMSLTSPGPGQRDPASMLNNLTKVAGNITASLIPGYATLRDLEQFYNGLSGAPSARPYQSNLLSTFAQTVPFASKVGSSDLDHLGGNVQTQVFNSLPFLRRLAKFGVDSSAYNEGDRSPSAVHNKLISMFASNRFSLDWDAGPLKDFALQELVAKSQKEGIPLTADDFFDLSRELTPDEKYEWLNRAGPVIQNTLTPLIPQLEQLPRAQFIMTVRGIVNPIKRAILYQVLSEKNKQDILLKKPEEL